ncbi:MAG: glycosyltransferase family 2 protein [Burkholderiaceae bacterium]
MHAMRLVFGRSVRTTSLGSSMSDEWLGRSNARQMQTAKAGSRILLAGDDTRSNRVPSSKIALVVEAPFRSPADRIMRIAVVIPYFQRESGPLERALRSIGRQLEVGNLSVIVVDDESPVSAETEVARLGPSPRFPIAVIRQPNGGPAAARNRGLAAVPADTDYVAFLDSDDEWEAGHLANAMTALGAGHDFYFADLLQLGQQVSGFARAGRITVANHPPIGNSAVLHSYIGDMFDQIITGNVIGTSTVVYDFRRFAASRFDEAFFSAGEDYLFWIGCARAGARFCFSSDVEARYGAGVNVYSGSGWGTDGFMRRVQNEMRYRKRLLQFDLDPGQRRFVEDKIVRLRIEFADDVLHRLSHRKVLPMHVLRMQFALDARTLFEMPIHAGQIVARRLRGSAPP